MTILAVTFDAGQTLVELDPEMLAARLGERGVIVAPAVIDAAGPVAWRHHEQQVAGGAVHPWKQLVTAWLAEAGVAVAAIPGLVDWLWDEQPTRNLWRRAVAGMREVVEELHQAGLPLAVLSNSEGKLAELLVELDWARYFVAIADSGKLGVAKPDPAIFAWTVAQLGVPAASVVHIGDSLAADVDGALAAGLRAVWFHPAAHPLPDRDTERVAVARDAAELRRALARWRSEPR